jgi:hypothetical protein
LAESQPETSQPSEDSIPDSRDAANEVAREEPTPVCISANAKLNIDDTMLSYFGDGCR